MSLLKKCLPAAVVAVVVAGALVGGMFKWANSPVELASPELDITIKSHSTLRSVALQLDRGGAHVQQQLFVLMTRALGLSSQLKSGNYAFKEGITPYEMLQKIARGDVNEYVATVIEGWTFQKMRNELDGNPALQHDTAGMTDTDPRGQKVVDDSFLLYFNAHDQPIDFRLLKPDYGQAWQVILDTALPDPSISTVVEAEATIAVAPRSLVVLQGLD